MKIKFTRHCMDKFTNENYNQGMIKEFDDERALEIINSGYAVKYQDNNDVVDVRDKLDDETKEETETDDETETKEDDTPELEPVELHELTMNDLKEIAKELGVAIRGSKDEIIARIEKKQEELTQ